MANYPAEFDFHEGCENPNHMTPENRNGARLAHILETEERYGCQ
jgi:hypothetical protein